MSKKVFKTFVAVLTIAAAATGPVRAQSNTVRWEKYQISEFNLMSGDRETLYDVTLTSNGGTASDNGGDIQFNGAFTFSVPAGSVLTQIVIKDETWLGVTGWSREESQTEATWTGSARSVACDITASNVQYIEFTIASAVRKMYTSEVSITDLVPGDTLAEGATIIGSGSDDDMVSLDFGRTKKNGVVPSFWENLGLPPTVIGTNGTISKTNNTYTPVDGNGQDGNAWVVTTAILNDYDGFEVGLSGITIPVYRTLDSIPMGWTVKVGEAAAVSPTAYTDGGSATKGFLQVEQGQQVLLVPSAEDKPRVKSVTLEDAAPAVQTVHVGGNVDATLYYLPGETWRQAIENHSTENAGFSISGDKVRYNGTRVYIGSFGDLNPNTVVDPNGDYRALLH